MVWPVPRSKHPLGFQDLSLMDAISDFAEAKITAVEHHSSWVSAGFLWKGQVSFGFSLFSTWIAHFWLGQLWAFLLSRQLDSVCSIKCRSERSPDRSALVVSACWFPQWIREASTLSEREFTLQLAVGLRDSVDQVSITRSECLLSSMVSVSISYSDSNWSETSSLNS